MKTKWIGVAICGIMIGLLYLFGKPFIWSPKLVVAEESWDFGQVNTGSVLKHAFVIKNAGKSELTLIVYPNCPRCIHLELEKPSIPPGGATILRVEIFAKAEGPYEVYLMLESNDPRQRVKKLTLKGMFVTP